MSVVVSCLQAPRRRPTGPLRGTGAGSPSPMRPPRSCAPSASADFAATGSTGLDRPRTVAPRPHPVPAPLIPVVANVLPPSGIGHMFGYTTVARGARRAVTHLSIDSRGDRCCIARLPVGCHSSSWRSSPDAPRMRRPAESPDKSRTPLAGARSSASRSPSSATAIVYRQARGPTPQVGTRSPPSPRDKCAFARACSATRRRTASSP